jgi:hypothetical protein
MLTTPAGFEDSTVRVTDDHLAAAGREYYRYSLREAREGYFGVLSADGTTLHHGTYLSGYYTFPRGYDALSIASTIARTAAGTVYVGGSTDAESFPTTDGGFRPRMSGIADGFVVEWKRQPFRVTSESVLPVAEIEGAPYFARLESSGGTAPVQWEVVGGFRLVEGLSLTTDGVVLGVARQAVDAAGAGLTEAGAYQFTAKATDGSGAVAYKSFFLPIRYDGQPKCANGTCATQGHVGDALPVHPPRIPNRARPPFTLSVTGTLPPGVTVDANGEFRGRTSAPGRYLVTQSVRDSTGRSVALTWDVTIVDPNPPSPPTTAPSPSPAPGGVGAAPQPSSSGGGGGQVDTLSLAALLFVFALARSLAAAGPISAAVRSSRSRRRSADSGSRRGSRAAGRPCI